MLKVIDLEIIRKFIFKFTHSMFQVLNQNEVYL